MHLIVLGICKCSSCLIKATLQWSSYSTASNVLTLFNKISQTIKIELNLNFLAFMPKRLAAMMWCILVLQYQHLRVRGPTRGKICSFMKAFLHNKITIVIPVATHLTDLVAVLRDKSQQMSIKVMIHKLKTFRSFTRDCRFCQKTKREIILTWNRYSRIILYSWETSNLQTCV